MKETRVSIINSVGVGGKIGEAWLRDKITAMEAEGFEFAYSEALGDNVIFWFTRYGKDVYYDPLGDGDIVAKPEPDPINMPWPENWERNPGWLLAWEKAYKDGNETPLEAHNRLKNATMYYAEILKGPEVGGVSIEYPADFSKFTGAVHVGSVEVNGYVQDLIAEHESDDHTDWAATGDVLVMCTLGRIKVYRLESEAVIEVEA